MNFHWRNLSVVRGFSLLGTRFLHLGFVLLLGATMAVPAAAVEATASLVRDIREGFTDSLPEHLENVDGTVFFEAYDGQTGRELWKSDGTEQGTVLVKDINPGTAFDDSSPGLLTNVNGTLFFVADDGEHGRELWKSDGTESGTVLVKDIRPGDLHSHPRELTAVGDTLYFRANHPDHSRELWKSDGTEEGTVVVKDINPGGASDPGELTRVDDTLFFQADDGVHGIELWKSDGTEAGTVMVKNIRTSFTDSDPLWLTNVNGTLFFVADDGEHVRELWKSDGTEQGTVLVKDIHETGGSFPVRLQNVNGLLMFSANDGIHGRELWASDGTESGTYLVKDINPEGSSQPTLYGNHLSVFYMSNVAAGDRLFFRAYDGTTDTSLSISGELWISDGTEEGTFQVKDIHPAGESQPSWITAIGNNVFFKAEDGVHHNDLFFSDGTEEGTFRVDDFRTDGGASVPSYLTNVNGVLMLSATDGGISAEPRGHGRELWKAEVTIGNQPPAIAAIQDQSVTVGEQIVVEPAVSDPEDDPFTLTWEGVPDGAVVNGFFSWTPQAGDEGDYEITVTATQDDNPDLSDSETFMITVLASDNQPPEIEAIISPSVFVGEELVVEPVVSDPEDDPFTLTWEGVPDGAVVNGFFSWTPQPGDEGDYIVTVTATQDDNPDLFDSESFVVSVLAAPDNQPPEIDSIDEQSVLVGEQTVVQPVVSDPEDDPFTLTWDGVPDGAVVNGEFSWTPQPGDEGDYIVTVTATQDDNPDLSDSESFVVSVFAAPDNQPPEIDSIDDQSVLAGEHIVVQTVVSDPEDDPFTLTWEGVPDGAVVNSFFSWTPEADDVGDYLVTVTATQDDNPDLSDSESFAIRVVQPPELDVPDIGLSDPPMIDGVLDLGEWGDAVRLETENGFLAFMHDRHRLYILVDALDDDGDDPFVLGGGDQFWLHFDVNEDGIITPDVDLRFRLESGTGNLRYQTYCEACTFGFNPLESTTLSSRGEGFGCFFEDGSLFFATLGTSGGPTCNEHRIWELAIDLGEIGMRNGSTQFGYLVASGDPLQSENFPPDLNDMNHYGLLALEGVARQLVDNGPGVMDPNFEVTQAVQTVDNDLDLVAGKTTALRIWDATNESIVKTFMYGTRNGVDLPGSPLLDVGKLSEGVEDPRSDDGLVNAFVELSESWAAGDVQFDISVHGLDGLEAASMQDSLIFAPTEVPVFWIVPIRNNLSDGTEEWTTLPSDTAMLRSERMLRSMVPLDDIDIVYRPVLDVLDIATSAGLKTKLKEYDQQTILTWTLGLAFTGEAPFPLPEQITGYNQVGLGGVGGSSDTHWGGGDTRITWTNSNPTTYIHELNHNLDNVDLSTGGTWGKHAPGCDSEDGGPLDPAWPYDDALIQEPAVHWSVSRFRILSDETPDLMTYCRRNGVPDRWISPYRWSAWLDRFRTGGLSTAAMGMPMEASIVPGDSFHIIGRVFPDGSGQFDQVLRQPGLPSAGSTEGTHEVQIRDCGDSILESLSFTPSFTGEDAEFHDHVTFTFTMPAASESCVIELYREGLLLGSRDASANPPVVSLISPNGGESWDGVETVAWDASDIDSDPLQFTLLYSADGGHTWLPVDTGIIGNSYDVDTTGLPGSTDARIRILASDGFHTAEDDSDESFALAVKPPTVQIHAPVDNGLYPVDQPLILEGVARDTFGQRLPFSELIWAVNGEPVGQGKSIRVNLQPGDHVITLAVPGEDDELAMASVAITIADLGPTEDSADTGFPGVDLSSAHAFVAGDRLHCEMEVRSGESGLTRGSRYACHIDFDNLELEGLSECDADGDGVLDGEYRLGSNGPCSTSDIAITYRHDRKGGTCTGGPGTDCSTREFSAGGSSDGDCDGDVDGEPAATCKILVSGLLSTIGDERDLLCTDAPGDCLGGVNGLTDDYRAYLFFEAHYRRFKDWAPDTDDGGSPNSTEEVLQIPLVR